MPVKRTWLAFALMSSLIVVAGPAARAAVGNGPMIRVGQDGVNSTSTNWSGYATFNSGTTFTDVQGSWTQPTATCSSKKKTYSSFWVGIDGYNSGTVEQTGTSADCKG